MSQSSHGGGVKTTSTNPQDVRPSETKHGGEPEDDGDVFLGPQQGTQAGPQTPKKKNIFTGFTERFARSPSETDRPNRKRRTDNNNGVRDRTDTVVQSTPQPTNDDSGSDMDTTDSDSTTRAEAGRNTVGTQQTDSGNATNVASNCKVTEAELELALISCLQMASEVATNGDDNATYRPSTGIAKAYESLGLLLDLSTTDTPIRNMGMDYEEFEGVYESMHAPKNTTKAPSPENGRISLLETAVADMASKLDALTRAVLQGRTNDTSATPTSNGTPRPTASTDTGTADPPTTDTRSSFATGPTFKPTAKPKPISSFAARHHESRLIIKITPTPTREQQAAHSGLRIRDAINDKLRMSPETNHMFIGLVSWSNIGSAIINTTDGLTAAELEPHAHKFTELLPHSPDGTFVTQTDTPWFKVTINGVPTRGGGYSEDAMESDQPDIPDSQLLLDELLHFNGWLKTRKIVGKPRWISAPEMLASRDKSSIVVAFANQEDADELIKRRGVFMFGHRATTRMYIDIPPLRHCTNCWKLDHMTKTCNKKPRCRFCAGEHATAEHACNLCESMGSSCEHCVVKCVHCQDSDSPHFADSFACPYRRAYKGEAMATPRSKGGRKKRKNKPKTTPQDANNTLPATPARAAAPTLSTPEIREGVRKAVKIGVPSATDQQIQDALTLANYELGATFTALGKAIIRNLPDTTQPDIAL